MAEQANIPLSAKETPRKPENLSEAILKDILSTMQDSDLFPKTGTDTSSLFWLAYERVANQHDGEFLERHNSDLDVLLIFAGLFSAVSSAFIVGMTNNLTPAPSDTTNALLKILINKVANGTFSDQDASLPVWTGPGSIVIWIQSLAYTSLATSLLAAAGAVLGKQWLGYFKVTRLGPGSLEERCTRRHQKYIGLKTWHFHAVISMLPILLQLSLLFFGISLAGNIWLLQPTIAGVIIGTTIFGAVVYVLTVLASLTSPHCPFQTPVSTSIRHFLQHGLRTWKTLSKSSDNWLPYPLRYHITNVIYTIAKLRARFRAHFTRILSRLRLNSRLPPEGPEFTGGSHIVLSKNVLNLELPPTDPVRARAVQWILETSTDTEIITTAAKMVVEIEWPYEHDIATVTNRLKGHFVACFNPAKQLLPFAQSRALACMNAIVHCCLKGNLPIPFLDSGHHGTISYFDPHGIIYYRPSGEGLKLINCVLNIYDGDALDTSSLSSSGRMWVAHVYSFGLYHGHYPPEWEDAIIDFMGECFQDTNSPPRLVADCLVLAAQMLGFHIDPGKLAKLDKSAAIPTLRNSLMEVILKELPVDALQGATMSPGAQKLLHPWSLYIEKHSADRRSINIDVSIRYLKFCIHLLKLRQRQSTMEGGDKAISQHRVISQQVSAALRLALYFSGHKGNDMIWSFMAHHALDSALVLSRWSVPEWYTPAHCDLVLDYLMQIYKGTDYTLIGNTYVILGGLGGLPSTPEGKNLYIQAIMHSMGPKMPIFVRYAALNAACMIRREIVSMAQDNNALRAQFSQSLSSAANIDGLSPDSDPQFYKERDLCYLKLLCVLCQNPAWHNHLEQYGHFGRCLFIALTVMRTRKQQTDRWYFAAYGIYVAYIFTMIDGLGILTEPEYSQAIRVYQSWSFSLEALCFIFSFTFFVKPDKHDWDALSSTGYYQALPHIIKYSETWESKEETSELIRLVTQVSKLLEGSPVGNNEIKDLGLKIRRLLYSFLKDLGMKDILHSR